MTIGTVERFGMTGGRGSELAAHEVNHAEVGVAELEALAQVDIVRAEHLDLASIADAGQVFERRSHSDDLRLPPPPFRSQDGDAIFRQLGRAVDTFTKNGGMPVAASEPALTAEAKMMTVLRGIHRLELEIHARRDRHRAV
jgi:hypothetical protein